MNKSYEAWWSSLDNYWKLKIAQGPYEYWAEKQRIVLKENYNSEEIEGISLSVKKLSFSRENLGVIPDLSYLKNLETFAIGWSTIDNYENLNKLVHIKFLELCNVDIDNINFISKFHSLNKLNLFSTKVSSLNPLQSIFSLEELRFYKQADDKETRINDLNSIRNLKNLKVLQIDKDVKNIEPISNFSDLEEFSYFQIESFEHLRNLKKLKTIFVMCENKSTVSDLSPLSELNKLEHLDISFSRVTNLSPIYKLKNLKLFVYKDTPLDKEYNNFLKRSFGKTEIQMFNKINPNCELRNYK